jgi:DnaJ-class molecular chaperone
MSAVATETATLAGPFDSEERLFEPSEVTLEDSVLGAWEALEARGSTECVVCHGETGIAGCPTCGSRLS